MSSARCHRRERMAGRPRRGRSVMFRITCRSSSAGSSPAIVKRSSRPSASSQGSRSRSAPCQAMSGIPRSGPVRREEAVGRQARDGGDAARSSSRDEAQHVAVRALSASSRTRKARCPGSRRCCCRAGCAAPRRPRGSSARPRESIRMARKLLACRRRSARTAGSVVSPSAPQFQLRLSLLPSRLSSPFASLCLWS